jgi:hypothetical protein
MTMRAGPYISHNYYFNRGMADSRRRSADDLEAQAARLRDEAKQFDQKAASWAAGTTLAHGEQARLEEK